MLSPWIGSKEFWVKAKAFCLLLLKIIRVQAVWKIPNYNPVSSFSICDIYSLIYIQHWHWRKMSAAIKKLKISLSVLSWRLIVSFVPIPLCLPCSYIDVQMTRCFCGDEIPVNPEPRGGGYYPNPANSLLNKHWTTETSIECTCELGGKILYESLSNEQGLVLYVERAKISVFFVTIQFPVCFGGDIISIHDLDHEPHVELSDSFVVFPPLCLVFDVQMTFCFWGWNCPEASLSQIGRRSFQIQNVTDLRLVCTSPSIWHT